MNRQQKSLEIIERIEYIRSYLRLNKSRFSAEIGLKPQTYNNFIGAQGSKPSVELILGTVNRFGASPNWVLNGSGPVFQERTSEQDARTHPGMEMGNWASHLSDPGIAAPGVDQQHADLSQKLSAIEEKVQKSERRLEIIEGSRFPAARDVSELLMQLFEVDPAKAEQTAEDLKSQLRRMLGV